MGVLGPASVDRDQPYAPDIADPEPKSAKDVKGVPPALEGPSAPSFLADICLDKHGRRIRNHPKPPSTASAVACLDKPRRAKTQGGADGVKPPQIPRLVPLATVDQIGQALATTLPLHLLERVANDGSGHALGGIVGGKDKVRVRP